VICGALMGDSSGWATIRRVHDSHTVLGAVSSRRKSHAN
jgi:hypothetical protein